MGENKGQQPTKQTSHNRYGTPSTLQRLGDEASADVEHLSLDCSPF